MSSDTNRGQCNVTWHASHCLSPYTRTFLMTSLPPAFSWQWHNRNGLCSGFMKHFFFPPKQRCWWCSSSRMLCYVGWYVPTFQKFVKCTLVQALRLCTGCTAHRGSRGIALLFLDHGTSRGEGSASRPGRSLPSGKTRYPFYRRLGGPQVRSVQVRKISPPPRFDPRTVQPVASRYTDWTFRKRQWHFLPASQQAVAWLSQGHVL